jgi:2,5-furandicarboxylate decarboxylase 1
LHAIDDLRTFLDVLDQEDLLERVEHRVDPSYEVAQLMLESQRRGRAVLFRDVTGSEASVVYNLVGSRRALALALGTDANHLTKRFRDALEHRIPPVQVTEAAPVQEIIHVGDDVDLRALPLVTHAAKDAGPYITAGVVIANDPDTGARNVSINRMMLVSPTETGIRMMPPQQLGVIQSKAEAQGHDLPVAIAIGLHPAYAVAAATSLPPGEDEFELAGGLRGDPVRMTRGITVDIDLPADAEIAIEGFVRAGVREPEGPFGDFLEFYVPRAPNHRFVATAVTHRTRPIYQTMVAASPEDVNLLGLSREADIVAAVERTGAEVVASRVGPTILGCTLAIRQRYEGEAKNVGMTALGAYRWLKYVIVVDHDVDVEDMDDVWWAVTSRSNPTSAIGVIDGAAGFPRDPHHRHRSKAIIDATIPFGEWVEFERKQPPRSPGESADELLRRPVTSNDGW